MKSACVLPLWLLWATPSLGVYIPPAAETTTQSWEQEPQLEPQPVRIGEFEYLTSYAKEDIIPTSRTVSVRTTSKETDPVVILPSLSDVEPHTEGFVIVTVSNPAETDPPLLTSPIPSPTSLLQPIHTVLGSTSTAETRKPSHPSKRAVNIFGASIDVRPPQAMFERRTDHPVPRLGITKDKDRPLQTNKFYSNFFLGDQTNPVFTFPYSLAWSGGKGPAASWGMAVSHIDASQRFYGPVVSNNAVQYYANPIGIQSMVIGAKELGSSTVLATDSMTPFFINARLRANKTSVPAVTFPITQGMMYTTAQFNGAVPIVQSGVYFKNMTKAAVGPKTGVRKFTFDLEDGTRWRLYAYKLSGDPLDLQVVNNGYVQSKKPFYGIIQVAKDTRDSKSEAVLDDGCGIYAAGMTLTGTASGPQGTYSFEWQRAGHPTGCFYQFALPHHVSSLDASTKTSAKSCITGYQMLTTTKGMATAVAAERWTMVEPAMPVNMGFLPYNTTLGSRGLSTYAKSMIWPVALQEVSQDMMEQTNLDSMYFSGKALAKFGMIVYVINTMLGDTALGQAGLMKLKEAFSKFVTNKQKHPLYYESAWGGLVSSASYTTGDPYYDFGNTYYNDHHFHWGYHILTAAYIASMDKTWLSANRQYIDTLIRDMANPTTSDTWFPQWRSFDWYHGHSWAHGLFAQWDGKNQESSSEDVMAAYAIKMWATVVNAPNLLARANLQLAVMARSMPLYYLYTSDNTVQPSNFIGNKVAGILFENKIDHTTFFDGRVEAVHGIHMLPLLPASNLARSSKFVLEEWNVFFSQGRVDNITSAWKGVIYGNYATIEPRKAWDFFRAPTFNSSWLDGGASRTWYLAYAAALGGV